MARCRIQLVCAADGRRTTVDGHYVQDFSPEPAPHGTLQTTRDPLKARVFDSTEALEFYRQAHGTRPDGEPNRPITAFTVVLEPAR
jgi:hypothetical protein